MVLLGLGDCPSGLRPKAFLGEAPWPGCGMLVAHGVVCGAGAIFLAYAQGSDTTGR